MRRPVKRLSTARMLPPRQTCSASRSRRLLTTGASRNRTHLTQLRLQWGKTPNKQLTHGPFRKQKTRPAGAERERWSARAVPSYSGS